MIPLSIMCLSVTLAYCGQTVEWIKIPVGTEVGLDPDDIVLDADPALTPPHGKAHSSQATFRRMSVVAKRSPILATVELLFSWSAFGVSFSALTVTLLVVWQE